MITNYPARYDDLVTLMRRLGDEGPEVMAGFVKMHSASTDDGVLSAKVKELMALAIGINVRCDGCIAYHVHDAIHAGASRAEVIETIGVAIMMGGGPSVVYGCEALNALDQFAPPND
jgi:AhpD family alkylhydroperoxidase